MLLSAAIIGCHGRNDSLKRVVPDAMPTFVEAGFAVGFRASEGARNTASSCLFHPTKLAPKFPALKVAGYVNESRFNACSPERNAGGAAAVDVNGDGRDDIVMSRLNGHPLLYLNESTIGRPKFVDSTTRAGLDAISGATNGVAYADVDNDGDEDVALSSMAGTQMYLMINDGLGKFTEEAVPRGVAMSDGNPHAGTSIGFGDFDLDGWIDMYAAEWQSSITSNISIPSHSRLFRNLGASGKAGVFEDVTVAAGAKVDSKIDSTWTFSSTFADFDGDDYPDLLVVADFNTSKMFWNNRDGTFTESVYESNLGAEENGMGIAIGFRDVDQRPSLFVTAIKSESSCSDDSSLLGTGNRLYVYKGNRQFEDVTDVAGVRDGGWAWGATYVDATNTGSADLVQAAGIEEPWIDPSNCHARDPIRYWRNGGDGSFDEVSKDVGVNGTKPSKAVIAFDADNDGRTDIFITRDAQTPLFFHNVTPNVGHHVDLRITGTRSNRDAIGAVVTVTAVEGGRSTRYFAQSAGSYLSQDSRSLRIGLGGGVEPVHRIEVYFPASKRTVVLREVTRDTTVNVVEPQGTSGSGAGPSTSEGR